MGEYNIGIATGEASGITVLDIDPRHGGTQSLNNLEDRNGPLPDTWVAHTGGGGMHIFFQYIPGVTNRAGMVPGVDVKNDNGYIVAPPSIHKSGDRYVWDDVMRPSGSFQQPAAAPDWLVKLMGGSREGDGRARPLPEKIGEGERNDWLASIAGTMRARNMSHEAIEAALQVENQLRCDPMMDTKEVGRIAWSVSRYPAAMAKTISIGGRGHG